MTGLALLLVLTSALIHASWNFLLKKSGGGPGLIAAACLALARRVRAGGRRRRLGPALRLRARRTWCSCSRAA